MQRIEAQGLIRDPIQQVRKVLPDRLGGAIERIECGAVSLDLARLDLGDQALGFFEKPRHPLQPDDLHGAISLVKVRLRSLKRFCVGTVRRKRP